MSCFRLDIPKDKDITPTENKLFSILNNIDTLTFTNADVERAKNSLLKQWENITNNTQRYTINFTEMIGAGDWRLWYLYRDNIEKLKLDDIYSAIKKYYKKSNRTWGKFIPENDSNRVYIPEIADINEIVKDYKGKEIKQTENYTVNIDTIIKNAVYKKLGNGAKYVIFNKPTKSDLINARIKINIGSESSLQNTAKRNEILAKLLNEGTKTKTKAEINDALDKLKSEVRIYGGSDDVSIFIKTQKSNFNEVMKIVNDLLRNPKFSEADFNKVIAETITSYEEYQNDPQEVVYLTSDKLSSNYPKGHPFYTLSSAEAIATLKSLKLTDITSFYTDFYGGNNAEASFVGALNIADVHKNMQTIFGNWNAKNAYSRIANKHFDVAGKTEIINIKDKTNAACNGILNLAISKKDSVYAAIYMANELLGGGAFLSSRIPNRLREKEGLSYGAGSFLYANYLDKSLKWGLYAFFNPNFQSKLDSALLEEIEKAKTIGFTLDELQKSKESWLQGEKTNLGSDGYVSYLLLDYLDNNINIKDYKTRQEQIKNVSLQQVNDAMKKYFDVKKLILVYAGDFNKK
jgi:zinc protease